MPETGPIMVFAGHGKWLVHYGSYTHGEYATRREAVVVAAAAADSEGRGLVIEAGSGRSSGRRAQKQG